MMRGEDAGARISKDVHAVPADQQAERIVLGTVLAFEDRGPALMRVALEAGVSAESFYTLAGKTIWTEAEVLMVAGRQITPLAVVLACNEHGTIEAAGGFAEIERLASEVARTASLATFKESFVAAVLAIKRKEVDREAQRRARALVRAIGADDHVAAADEARRAYELVGKGERGSALPQILSWEGFVGVERPEPPELVAGVLHQGAKLMLGGGSKSFKTWCLLDLGLSIATGSPWWGMATKQTPVLYVNFELQTEFCQRRVKQIAEAKGIKEAPLFHSWHLRGYARDLRELVPHFIARTIGSGVGLIVLDPIYKVLGDRDENSNGEVAQLLNEVEALAVQTKTAIAFGHHFSKGNQAAKDTRDRVSGAGSWTRDPDALITLTPHEEDDAFVAEFTLRNCRPKQAYAVRWKFPCMEVAPGLNPASLKEAGRPKKHTLEDLLEVLMGEELTSADWQERARLRGISKATFHRLLLDAKQGRLVKQIGGKYARI